MEAYLSRAHIAGIETAVVQLPRSGPAAQAAALNLLEAAAHGVIFLLIAGPVWTGSGLTTNHINLQASAFQLIPRVFTKPVAHRSLC